MGNPRGWGLRPWWIHPTLGSESRQSYFSSLRGDMTPLGKLTEKAETVLRHLVKRGHAMTASMLRDELQMKYLWHNTFEALRVRNYIRLTDQGWLATDAGRLRVSDVV
jgi:hypothetical protein